MSRVGLDPEVLGEAEDLVLRRPDPLAAQLDDVLGVLADRLAQGPAADSVPGLQHPHVEPGGAQLARRGQPAEARTDDNDVTVMHRRKYPALPFRRPESHAKLILT